MSEHRFDDEWITRAAVAAAGQGPVDLARSGRKKSLAEALIAGGLNPEALCKAVAEAFHVGADVHPPLADRNAVALVPDKICKRHRLVPLRLLDEKIEIAMESPLDLEALADVTAVTGRSPSPVYVPPGVLDGLMARAFDPEAVVDDLLERYADNTEVQVLDSAAGDGSDNVRAPIIKLVNSIVARAIQMKASDIHIEHDEKSTVVRVRVDGALRVLMTVPRFVGAGPVVARLKIMSNLDIADRMRPQDGRAKLRVGLADVGLRVSTLPTNFGEKVVIRILDQRAAEVPFEKLGFRAEIAAKITELCLASQGLLLVTGPTGSGKTTSLYSILNRLKSVDTNIVTVEDPIEYKLDGINQVQVQEKQGLTFAAILRSVLRQDPDVILLGEIRDRETADTALQAAQTGHLVFSTLHTNDTISTIARLADMGVERYKLTPGLLGITAQRLVRRLCPACRVETTDVPAPVAAAIKAAGLPVRMYEPKGCKECADSGYKGRVSLIELLVATNEMRKRIGAGDDAAALKSFAVSSGALMTMEQDAAVRLSDGTTTLEEVAPYARFSAAAEPAPAPAAEAPASASAPKPAAGGGKRILAIDDDAAIRIIVRSVLGKAGFTVTEAPDGVAGLEKLSTEPPDLLVVDMNMPALDGPGVIRAARESLGLTMPIIVLTSDADDKSQETAFSLGADDYVIKPVKPGILLARVEAALRRSAAYRN